MCRIRFHRDGIYLSFVYIQTVEEPYHPPERVYQGRSDSSLPYAIVGKRTKRNGKFEKDSKQTKKKKDRPCKVVEVDPDGERVNRNSSQENHCSSSSSSSSNSSLSSSSPPPSPSSYDDDRKEEAVQQGKATNTHSKPVNRVKKGTLQVKKFKASNKKNHVTTPPTEADEQSTVDSPKESASSLSDKHVSFSDTPSPVPSPAPSPSKQVRFSEKVGKREIPSDDASESSSSSDSSHESSVDKQAHALLQSQIEPSEPKALQSSPSMESKNDSVDTNDEPVLPNAKPEDLETEESLRFRRQKMLSPFSKVHKSTLKRIRKALHEPTVVIQSTTEDEAPPASEPAPDLQRSKERSGGLRTRFVSEGHALKSAMKKGKENQPPTHIDEEDVSDEIQIDEQT